MGGDVPVGAGSYQFGDGVGKGREGVYVEDGEGVFAVAHTALGEDDGYEVDAGGAEEGEGGGFCEELLID